MSPIWLALLSVVSVVLLPAIPPPARAQAPTGFIPSLDARVTSIRFFESPYELTPRGKRVYANWFERAAVRFIGWELNLDHPAPASRKSFSVEEVWLRSDGTILVRQQRRPTSSPLGRARITSTAGVGDFFVDGQRAATGTSTIFRPSRDAATAFERGIQLRKARKQRFVYAREHEFDRALPDCNRALAAPREDFMELIGSFKIQLEAAHLCLDLACNAVFDGSRSRRCPACAGEDTYPLSVWLDRAEGLSQRGRLTVKAAREQGPVAAPARIRAA